MRQISIPVNGRRIVRYGFAVERKCPDFLIQWFTDWLTEYLNSGVEISDGQYLQYGWVPLRCVVESGRLEFLAPDFESFPIQWQPDITKVFYITMEHKFVPESFGLEFVIPTLRDTCVVGTGFADFPMIMSREPAANDNPQDSGWFLGSLQAGVDYNNADNLELMSLYEAVLNAPHILRYLSMPMGTQAVFRGELPVVFVNEQRLQPAADSYLAQKLRLESSA